MDADALGEYLRGHLDDIRHGSKAVYDRHKCRCGPCRAANAKYMREYRANPYTTRKRAA